MISEIFYFTTPLLASGLIHHFWVIKRGYLSSLVKPIDFNLTLNGKRLFGNSKTFRGFVVIISLSSITIGFLSLFSKIHLNYNPLVSGALLGLGYSLGELPNSFIKRRMGMKEGTQGRGKLGILFYFFDQVDSIVGSLIFLLVIYSPTWKLLVSLFLVGTTLHVAIDTFLYFKGYKQTGEKPFFLEKQRS